MSTTHAYQHPPELDRSDSYTVTINGTLCDVLRVPYHDGNRADVVICDCSGSVEIAVECVNNTQAVTIHPLHLGFTVTKSGEHFQLQIPAPRHLVINCPGSPSLFLLLAEELDTPSADAIRFETGKIHDIDNFKLSEGQEIWIEGGAVVRGAIIARGPGCRVRGRGILDGSCFDASGPGCHLNGDDALDGYAFDPQTARRRTLILDGCHNGVVEGITIINPSSWSCVLGACDGAVVRDLRVFGDVICTDGIDVVGCSNVLVEGCLIANNDDCIAIKSLDIRGHDGSTQVETDRSWALDIRHIEVRNCILLSGPLGNAIEIGGETSCDTIEDVHWHDLDILCVHGQGAPFSIRLADRAKVSRILYEDIRVEHHWELLLRLRIISDPRYLIDHERGHMSDITFRRIQIAQEDCNHGHAVALIGGYDETHRVSGVHFEDFVLGGQLVTNPHQLTLFSLGADNITFGN